MITHIIIIVTLVIIYRLLMPRKNKKDENTIR
jgi:hypothetical protein